MLTVPCWLRRFWETDNLFSLRGEDQKEEKCRKGIAIYPSICLSFFPDAGSISAYPPCPTVFFLAIHHIPVSNHILIAPLSSHLVPFFFFSPSPVFLSNLTGRWASLSLSTISYLYHSQSFIPPYSQLPFLLELDTWGMPLLHPMASEWFRWCDSSSLCGSDPVSQVKDFPAKGSQSQTRTCQCDQEVKTIASLWRISLERFPTHS